MSTLFQNVLTASFHGSVVILVVLALRLVLRKTPRKFICLLWLLAGLRLLMPFEIKSDLSLQPDPDLTPSRWEQQMSERQNFLLDLDTPETLPRETEESRTTVSAAPAQKPEAEPAETVVAPVEKSLDLMTLVPNVWLAVACCFGLSSLISYSRLKRQVRFAVKIPGGWECDTIETAFILGFIRPKIYIPMGMDPVCRRHILAHERTHLEKGDHWFKMVGYIALALHWFNPLVWVAFRLAGQDMEMSCDEAVLRQLGPGVRGDYATALLRLATRKNVIGGTPLAFGEGDTKGRVQNMAKWKKPRLWVSLLCGVLCVAVLVACGVNPGENPTTTQKTEQLSGGYGLITPEDCDVVEENGKTVFRKDGVVVGGVDIYTIPEGGYDPGDKTFLWLEKVGIPDYADSSLCYSGGMSGVSGSWEAEFVSDVAPGETVTVKRWHNFVPMDGKVYDLWVDCLLADPHDFAIRLMQETEETLPAEEQAEYDAIDRCREVMELVEQGSAHVVRQEEESGRNWDFYTSDGDFLTTMAAKDGTREQGYLYFQDAYFRLSQTGQWETGDEDWEESGSWLGNFVLNRSTVALMGTTQAEGGECIMLRVDKFFDMDCEDDHYFANFYFDDQGRFEKVTVTVDLFREQEFSFTEQIVTMDEATVRSAIAAEYEKAMG